MEKNTVLIDLDLSHKSERNNVLAQDRLHDLLETSENFFASDLIERGHA